MSLSTSPILAAAASNDLQGVRWLVEREAIPLDMIGDWFVPESRGAVKNLERKRRTPTMIAALHGSLEVLGYILQAGADPNVRSEDDERFTAMHCAASGGSAMSTDAIKMLLLFGADRTAMDAYGRQPVDVLPAASGGSGGVSANNSSGPNSSGPSASTSPPDSHVGGGFSGGRVGSDGQLSEASTEATQLRAGRYSAGGGTGAGVVNSGIGNTRHHATATTNATASVNQQQEPDEETRLSDDFRMYEFKVRRCSRTRAHDWTECPFTHPGEKARRRDPRRFTYCGTACPEFRKGSCPRSDACEFAHGVFECWLHPSRYRTQLCKDGLQCGRRACFFAHASNQLRPPTDAFGNVLAGSQRTANGGGGGGSEGIVVGGVSGVMLGASLHGSGSAGGGGSTSPTGHPMPLSPRSSGGSSAFSSSGGSGGGCGGRWSQSSGSERGSIDGRGSMDGGSCGNGGGRDFYNTHTNGGEMYIRSNVGGGNIASFNDGSSNSAASAAVALLGGHHLQPLHPSQSSAAAAAYLSASLHTINPADASRGQPERRSLDSSFDSLSLHGGMNTLQVMGLYPQQPRISEMSSFDGSVMPGNMANVGGSSNIGNWHQAGFQGMNQQQQQTELLTSRSHSSGLPSVPQRATGSQFWLSGGGGAGVHSGGLMGQSQATNNTGGLGDTMIGNGNIDANGVQNNALHALLGGGGSGGLNMHSNANVNAPMNMNSAHHTNAFLLQQQQRRFMSNPSPPPASPLSPISQHMMNTGFDASSASYQQQYQQHQQHQQQVTGQQQHQQQVMGQQQHQQRLQQPGPLSPSAKWVAGNANGNDYSGQSSRFHVNGQMVKGQVIGRVPAGEMVRGQVIGRVPAGVPPTIGLRQSSFQHLGMIEGVLGDEGFAG